MNYFSVVCKFSEVDTESLEQKHVKDQLCTSCTFMCILCLHTHTHMCIHTRSYIIITSHLFIKYLFPCAKFSTPVVQ